MTAAEEEDRNEVDLQLTPQLEHEGIVNRCVFYRKSNAVEVLLNHHYDSKTIVVPINKKDWNKTHNMFERALKRKGINKEHILLLSDILDDNYHVILSLDDADDDLESEQHVQHEEQQTETSAQTALRLAVEQCSCLFMDQFGTPYAAITVDDHIETLPLKSSRFKNWLCRIFYNSEGNILTSDNVTNVLSILKARAEFDSGDRKNLYLRVATLPEEPNTIYYDLTNKNWEFVKITTDGWSIVQSTKDTPILFRRHSNHLPQVYPTKSKEYPSDIFDRFMKLINIKKDDNEENAKVLLKTYIISLFFYEISKAILMTHGDEGAAKTTLQVLIKRLIDPSILRNLSFPKEINQLIQVLSHNYLAYFDNVSYISNEISDQLCRGSTGGGFTKRELYTDDDDVTYDFKRAIAINGITLAATRSDLLDRGLIIALERILKDKRREDKVIDAELDAIKPQLLSYIFDTLVEVLKVHQNGGIQLTQLPRMADYAKNAEIISRCLGYPENKFIEAFDKNVEVQATEAIEANIIGNVIIKLVEDNNGQWSGTATELLAALLVIATKQNVNTNDRSWPKRPNILSNRLKEIKAKLMEIGIVVTEHRDPQTRIKTIEIRKTSFGSLESFAGENHAQIASDNLNDVNRGSFRANDVNKPSFAKNDQNRAQNEDSERSNDANDPFQVSQGQDNYDYYPCYYCDYKTDSQDDYEGHVVMRHGHSPAYPNKAEIEKLGLKAQGKSWEK